MINTTTLHIYHKRVSIFVNVYILDIYYRVVSSYLLSILVFIRFYLDKYTKSRKLAALVTDKKKKMLFINTQNKSVYITDKAQKNSKIRKKNSRQKELKSFLPTVFHML